MTKFLNYQIVICIVVAYFLCSWFIPWHLVQLPYELSLATGFDIVVVLTLAIKFKFPIRVGLRPSQIKELVLPSILAMSSIGMVHFIKMPTPFSYIQNIFLHMVIIAPLVEELIFRFTFQNLISKSINNKKLVIILSALLFSLSHAFAFTFLPKAFFPFIFLQVIYTFFLGLFCAKSFYNNNILSPYLIHFIFNLFFYTALRSGIL